MAVISLLLGYIIYTQQKLKNKQLKRESEFKEALLKIEAQNKLQAQRYRISRDLHDNIGAQLTFIISSLDNLKYGFEIPERLNSKLSSISNFTSSTITELRDTIWAMNKSEISFEDLKSRISNFIEKANLATHNTVFKFSIENHAAANKVFSSVEGMNIYRIIQEAVNNAIKYANANTIHVKVSQVDDKMKILVKDDGKGFNVVEAEMGNGLNNMKKRAKELNAEISIQSSEGSGTIVTLTI